MYYYSNNYSKYIEKLKLEKSKVAFRQLVENSREDKSPDVKIQEVSLSKDVVKLAQESEIPSKDSGSSIAYEENSILSKNGGVVNTKNNLFREKSSNKISNPENNLSEKNGISFSTEINEFKNIEPNEVNINTEFTERTDSSKIKRTDDNLEKSENKLSVNNLITSKDSDKIEFEDRFYKKDNTDISSNDIIIDKSGKDFSYEIDDTVKDGKSIDKRDFSSVKSGEDFSDEIDDDVKDGKSIDNRDFASKRLSKIIYNIKQEKKWEGEFPHLVTNPKKQEVTNLNRQSKGNNKSLSATGQIDFKSNYKKHDAIDYESNLKYNYYPAGSYDEIDAKQTNAIQDAIATITNPSNWSSSNPAKMIVSALKVATDIVDMLNLTGPAKNINRSRNAQNEIRYDLKLKDADINKQDTSKKEFDDSKKVKNRVGKTWVDDGDEDFLSAYDIKDPGFLDKKEEPQEGNVGYNKTKELDEEEKVIAYILRIKNLVTGEINRYKFSSEEERNDALQNFSKQRGFEKRHEVTTSEVSMTKKEWNEQVTASISDEDLKDEFYDVETFYDEGDDRQVWYENANDNPLSILDKEKKYVNGVFVDEDGEEGSIGDFTSAHFTSEKENENLIFKYDIRDGHDLTNNIADKTINDTRWYDDKSILGKIYVMPPDYNNANNKNQPFYIPLQNNLTFEQMTRGATWNSINFFGRIGDVQQYVSTKNLEAINVTTKYFVDTDPENDADLEFEKKSGFTMRELQNIEMMYRSLVLPATEESNYGNIQGNTYEYFTRPPIINIVLGNPDAFDENNETVEPEIDSEFLITGSDNLPYQNLFTDVRSGSILYYRNFIVTNVTIDKNTNDYNYYTDGINKYYDTTGFTVTLTILEIDDSYLGSSPSFNDYEIALKKNRDIEPAVTNTNAVTNTISSRDRILPNIMI